MLWIARADFHAASIPTWQISSYYYILSEGEDGKDGQESDVLCGLSPDTLATHNLKARIRLNNIK